MICALETHPNNREVTRIRILFTSDGTRIEGCVSCTDQYLHSLYSTQKRTRHLPNGKSFDISAAHVKAIKSRRCAPDLHGTWTDNKGLGSDMRY